MTSALFTRPQGRSHRFDQIPDAMKNYRNFVVWRYIERDDGKRTKVLFSPLTGLGASVTNPHSWASFRDAVRTYEISDWDGIGFVFTKNDPFAGIDLDDAGDDQTEIEHQDAIYNAFNSYAEISPSGLGLHIIIEGSVPSGRRVGKIEIYSSERYFTMTGNVHRDVPIADCHTLLNGLWHSIRNDKPIVSLPDVPQSASDVEVIRRALNGANGGKFRALHTGQWQQLYASQSQADFAYIDILAFWTRNCPQIERLFLASPLGSRPKAKRLDYRRYMIRRAFDLLPPPIDMTFVTAQIDAAIVARQRRLGDAS